MTGGERHRDERAQWFGENIRKNRERKEMSQDALAAKMAERGWEWHQSTVYKIEHGARRTEAFELHDLAEVLGVPINQLFWPPAEVNESAMVNRSIGLLRRRWRETAEAVRHFRAAQESAKRTLAQSGDSEYERVRRTCEELRQDLEELTLDEAAAEGIDRYENPEEP